MGFKKWSIGAVLASLALAATAVTSAKADAIGVAVGSVGSSTPVGNNNDSSPVIGAGAIGFYIPLNGSTGIYGTGLSCGGNGFATCSDSGTGGGVLTMILRFTPVSTTQQSVLHIRFDDLDLIGVSDPSGHIESFDLLKSNGMSFTSVFGGPITTFAGSPFTAPPNPVEQDLTLNLGVLTSDPLYLKLKFTATETDNVRRTNTEEYLKAYITSVPGPIVGAGLPGLFAAGAGLLFLARRRRLRDFRA